MKRLYIIDLDGTTGLYHMGEELDGRMILRPGLKEGLALMGDARRVIATRGKPDYVQNVRKILTGHGIVFDAYYDKTQVALGGQVDSIGYFKDYAQIIADAGIDRHDQVVVIGDMIHLEQRKPFRVEEYRRVKFRKRPSLPIEEMRCMDHPSTPDVLYVIVPQVMTLDLDDQLVSLTFRAVIEHLERMFVKGGGSFVRGWEKLRRWDWYNEYVTSDELMQKASFQVRLGRTVSGAAGADRSELFITPFAQRYLFFKGRRRDWRPTQFIRASLETATGAPGGDSSS